MESFRVKTDQNLLTSVKMYKMGLFVRGILKLVSTANEYEVPLRRSIRMCVANPTSEES